MARGLFVFARPASVFSISILEVLSAIQGPAPMMQFRFLPLSKAVLGFTTAFILTSSIVSQAQTPNAGNAASEKQQVKIPGDLPAPLTQPPAQPRPADSANNLDIEEKIYQDVRNLSDPGERSLALARVARSAILSGNLDLARKSIFEGGDAAKQEPIPLVRDQRINSIITVALSLAEERMREPIMPNDPGDANPAQPSKMTPARKEQLRLAGDEWIFAAELARSMSDIVSRTEGSNRVVEGASYAIQGLRGEPVGAQNKLDTGDEAKTYIGNVLTRAANEAARIERPVWRDRSLVSVAQNAASADLFDLAIKVARMIPQPEIRTDALLRIAETQAMNNRQTEATKAYAETAQTIAMIPLDDPREVLAGVLIDSLISLGRFDDARASIVLYSQPERRGIALAAVAESQGRRGLADSAKKWIAEAPAELQPLLYRKVYDGVLTGLELNRGKLMMRP